MGPNKRCGRSYIVGEAIGLRATIAAEKIAPEGAPPRKASGSMAEAFDVTGDPV
jgi:hypothetical protein